MNDHITKPIEPYELYTKLARWARPDSVISLPKPAADVKPLVDTPSCLDTTVAIARMGGDSKLYGEILANIHNNQAQAVEKIRAALAANDSASAERLVHSLKGVAAMVGANSLAEAARELESALTQGGTAEECGMLIEAVASDLAQVMSAAAAYVNSQNGRFIRNENAPDITVLAAYMEHLISQLQAFDGEAVNTMQKIRQLIHGTSLAQKFTRLENHISNYDYELALNDARSLSSTLTEATA